MEQKNNCLQEKDKQVYLNGIRKFMAKGVPVRIDGERAEEGGLDRLFSPPEGTFYMADFVMEESPDADSSRKDILSMVCEGEKDDGSYLSLKDQKRFFLKEIRFDKAYHS